MDTVWSDMSYSKEMVYLDDIVVYTETWQNLNEVLRRPTAAGLKASPNKCEFGATSMQYSGHVVTRKTSM